MRALIGCEYSATVRDAFRAAGHDAWSCDTLPTEGDPKYHYQGNVLDIIDDDWDMMIAHPPCRCLTIAGAASYNDEGRAQAREEAIIFFERLQNARIPRIAIENPIPFLSVQARIGKYNQYVNPFDFGVPVRKRVCLWLKNLPELQSTNVVQVKPDKVYIRKSGVKKGEKYNTYYHQGRSSKERARFFPCIADAMVDQWSVQNLIKFDAERLDET